MTHRSRHTDIDYQIQRAIVHNRQSTHDSAKSTPLAIFNFLRNRTVKFIGIAALSAATLWVGFESYHDDVPSESQAHLGAIENCATAVTGRYDNPIELTVTSIDPLTISRPTGFEHIVDACVQAQANPAEAWDNLGTPLRLRPAVEIID